MTITEAIIKRIKDLMLNEHIDNPYQLAIKSGIDEKTVRNLLTGKTKFPSMYTMFYISIGLNVSLQEFFKDELFDIKNIDDN